MIALISYAFYFFSNETMNKAFLDQYEEFSSYEMINTNPIVYQVDFKNDESGYLVFSSEYGYQSDIVMATLVDNTGSIINVKMYSENETKVFFERLYNKAFFKKNFHGKPIKNGFSILTNVDGVSGATISSGAVSKAVHNGSEFIGKKYLNIDISNPYGIIQFGMVDAAIITMFVLVLIAHFTKNKNLRTLTLVYFFTLMGLKFVQFISYSNFISFVTFNFPSIYENLRWYLLFVGSVALVMFTGKNLYCTYICPFGAMQQMEFKFAKLNFFKVSKNIKKMFKILPGFIAWFAFVLAMFSKDITAANYEPFSLVFGRVGLGVQWILLPVTVFMSLFLMTYYCNYGCPVGFTWKILLKIRRKVKRIVWRN